MERNIEATKLDVAALPAGLTDLGIYTIRKADLHRLTGIERLPLKTLALRWLSARDLTDVPLPPTITGLSLWQSPKLRSLEGIEAAPNLTSLFLQDNGVLEDAAGLHHLPKLTALAIQGGMNDNQKIASLGFLDGMALEHLTLTAIQGADLDLGPVARMATLKEIDIHGRSFRPRELAKVAAAHPGFYAGLIELSEYPDFLGMRCKTCGGVQKQLFLRQVKFLWCPVCEATGLAKQLAKFARMVDAARLDNVGGAA